MDVDTGVSSSRLHCALSRPRLVPGPPSTPGQTNHQPHLHLSTTWCRSKRRCQTRSMTWCSPLERICQLIIATFAIAVYSISHLATLPCTTGSFGSGDRLHDGIQIHQSSGCYTIHSVRYGLIGMFSPSFPCSAPQWRGPALGGPGKYRFYVICVLGPCMHLYRVLYNVPNDRAFTPLPGVCCGLA